MNYTESDDLRTNLIFNSALENISSSVQLKFNPTLETLHTNLIAIKTSLTGAHNHNISNFILSTNSSLILLLVPLIVPIKDRLLIEFCFDAHSSKDLYSENYEQCKHFKEILESSQVLMSMGFDVSFTKTFG